MRPRTLFEVIIGAVVFFALPVSQAEDLSLPAARKVLRVAAVLGLTGYAAVHSENMQRGIELARQDLEAQGWQVELAVEDDGTESARSLSAVQALIAKGYRLFIGPSWSYQMAAAGPAYLRADVLAYGPATCSEVAGGPNDHVFHGVTAASAKQDPVEKWLKNKGFKRVAVLVAASAWGDVHRRLYRQAGEAVGAHIVYDQQYEYGQERTVLPVLIERLKAAAPDVIFSTSSAEGSAAAVRKLTELQVQAAFLSTDDIVDAVQQSLLDPAGVRLRLFALTIPVAEEFRKRFRLRFGREAGVYSDTAYDGMMMFAAAQAGTDGSPDQMRRFIRQRMNFDRNGDAVKNRYEVTALN